MLTQSSAPDNLPALTILQPYASAIVEGVKIWENRPWRPPQRLIGQTWVIHAAKSRRFLDHQPIMQQIAGRWLNLPKEWALGAIIGTARLVDVCEYGDPTQQWDHWSCGPWCWRFEEPHAFAQSIPYRGKQRVFYIPRQEILSCSH